MRNVYKIMAAEPEGKRSLERPRRILEDNINICDTEKGKTEWTGHRTGTGSGLSRQGNEP